MRCTRVIATVACVATLLAMALGAARAACPGDCDGSGSVDINELVKGVNIALGSLPVMQCPAFDTNGNGTVEVNELIAAVSFALSSCPATQVTIRVGSVSAAPGMTGSFSVSLTTAGKEVYGVQHDLRFPAIAPILAKPPGDPFAGDPDCSGNTSIAIFRAIFLPTGCAGSACEAIRVGSSNIPIPDGTVLYSCTVRLDETAVSGEHFPLTCANAVYVDSQLDQSRPADCIDGSVQVEP